MNKKTSSGYSYDDDEDYVPTKKVKYSEKVDSNLDSKKKHTLDSDEEEEDEHTKGKKYDVLQDEDIEGQEDSTIDFEGETKITPFNMKEEMEEGHFDQDGFYHFKKENEDLKDAWLDNIDWIKVKHRKDDTSSGVSGEAQEGDDDDLSEAGLISIYEDIIPFLKEGETISKALKRLGGNKKRLSSIERWKLKKQGKLPSEPNSDMEGFTKLTELANKVLETGNMDVYEETYEMINLKIQRSKASKTPAEASFDMFADETSAAPLTNTTDNQQSSVSSEQKDTFEEMKWLYRWENNDEAEVHGPFETQKMLRWQESGFFKDGAYVRKTTDQHGNWYHSARIDFDIYL